MIHLFPGDPIVNSRVAGVGVGAGAGAGVGAGADHNGVPRTGPIPLTSRVQPPYQHGGGGVNPSANGVNAIAGTITPQSTAVTAGGGGNSPTPFILAEKLVFARAAWLKLLYLCKSANTEVGLFGLTKESDPLFVEEVHLIKSQSSSAFVDFDDEAMAQFQYQMGQRGIHPRRCRRIWIHTHPAGMGASPSGQDMSTFNSYFREMDYGVMFIMAQGDKSKLLEAGPVSAQLMLNLRCEGSPTIRVTVPLKVEFESEGVVMTPRQQLDLLAGADVVAGWDADLRAKVSPMYSGSNYYSGYGGYNQGNSARGGTNGASGANGTSAGDRQYTVPPFTYLRDCGDGRWKAVSAEALSDEPRFSCLMKTPGWHKNPVTNNNDGPNNVVDNNASEHMRRNQMDGRTWYWLGATGLWYGSPKEKGLAHGHRVGMLVWDATDRTSSWVWTNGEHVKVAGEWLPRSKFTELFPNAETKTTAELDPQTEVLFQDTTPNDENKQEQRVDDGTPIFSGELLEELDIPSQYMVWPDFLQWAHDANYLSAISDTFGNDGGKGDISWEEPNWGLIQSRYIQLIFNPKYNKDLVLPSFIRGLGDIEQLWEVGDLQTMVDVLDSLEDCYREHFRPEITPEQYRAGIQARQTAQTRVPADLLNDAIKSRQAKKKAVADSISDAIAASLIPVTPNVTPNVAPQETPNAGNANAGTTNNSASSAPIDAADHYPDMYC